MMVERAGKNENKLSIQVECAKWMKLGVLNVV